MCNRDVIEAGIILHKAGILLVAIYMDSGKMRSDLSGVSMSCLLAGRISNIYVSEIWRASFLMRG